MSDIEKDLREYLEKEPNLSRNDRLSYLKTIFDKHLEVNKLDHLIPANDLWIILSDAKSQYTRMKFPVNISKKIIDGEGQKQIALMEAFLLYLNRMKLLKKLVKFDHRD